MSKNEKAKTRDINHPYELYQKNGWEWRVLKHYQTPDNEAKNPYARVLCAVKSPFTFGGYDMGDTYISDIDKTGYFESEPEIVDKW